MEGNSRAEDAALYEQLRALGSRFDPDVLTQTRALFGPLWSDKGDNEVSCETLSYGEEKRQVLDVYAGTQASAVLIFIPGGGFVGGSREGYGALGRFFASKGIVCIIADYRLAPEWKWPSGAEDVARVVAWVLSNREKFGAATDRVVLFGHSAGATHVAGYAFDETMSRNTRRSVGGIVLMSGIYTVPERDTRPNLIAYFGEDKAQYAARSPSSLALNTGQDLFLAFAQYDPPPFVEDSLALMGAAAAASGSVPTHAFLAGHNHISEVFAIGTRVDPIGDRLLDFIRNCAQR
jgi:triacylglycerol lipase